MVKGDLVTKVVYISAEGLERIKNELREVEQVKLPDIAVKIAEAKDLGDLSENAEYHEAKGQQSFLFGKAQELRYKIKNARVIDKNCNTDIVSVGCTVDVESSGEKMTFELVGSDEADPIAGKISVESPIGSALIGSKPGDKVAAPTPAGESEYKIVKIM
jgi:transcription elongation factor GreA